jgi:hypothetical protein
MRHYPLSGSPFRAGHDFISTPHWLRSGAQIPFSISNVLGIVTPTYSARAPCTLTGDESRRETQRPAAGKWSGRDSAMSASLIGRLGSSAFRLSTAHAFRQYHQNTPTIPSTPAATKTKINAEFSIQAIAGMPDAGHLYRWRSCPFLAQICLLGLIMAG